MPVSEGDSEGVRRGARQSKTQCLIMEVMIYSTRMVANAFLRKAKEHGVKLTHMKVQKLVFFIHAWSLALNNAQLLDERPEAWPYGPVFDSLYHDLKSFGSGAVDGFLTELNPATGNIVAMIPSLQDASFWSLFQKVWDRYGVFTAMQLSALTHESGGPWEIARKESMGIIPDDLIKNYYRKKLNGPAVAA